VYDKHEKFSSCETWHNMISLYNKRMIIPAPDIKEKINKNCNIVCQKDE